MPPVLKPVGRLESSRTVDVDYIVQNFNTISDSAITVTENDIKRYYKEHINQFKQRKPGTSVYLFEEISEADYKAAEQWINDIKPDFEAAADVKQS
jgi:peptidyl-prolyl cis-trans isomerase D